MRNGTPPKFTIKNFTMFSQIRTVYEFTLTFLVLTPQREGISKKSNKYLTVQTKLALISKLRVFNCSNCFIESIYP